MHVRRDQARQEIKRRAAPASAALSQMKLYAPAHPAAEHQPQFTEYNTHRPTVGRIILAALGSAVLAQRGVWDFPRDSLCSASALPK